MDIENKKVYTIITFIIIAVYCFMFIKSIVDGRFIESVGDEKLFKTGNFMFASIILLVFTGLFCLIELAFRKLKLLISYIIFAVISSSIIVSMPFFDSSGLWISFKWYHFIEIITGFSVVFLFFVIFIVSLLVKLCMKKSFSYKNKKHKK